MHLTGLLAQTSSVWTPVFLALGIGAIAAAAVFVAGRFFFKPQAVAGEVEDEDAPHLEPRREGEGEYDPEIARPASSMDRRQALRRGGNPVAVFLTDAEAESDPVRAYVLDRSTGGICLTVPEAVERGTVLSVRATNAPPTTPWVQIEVRNCRPVGDEFELGCKFLKTPPWNVLLLFG